MSENQHFSFVPKKKFVMMFDFIKLCQGSLWSYWYYDDKKEYFYELH